MSYLREKAQKHIQEKGWVPNTLLSQETAAKLMASFAVEILKLNSTAEKDYREIYSLPNMEVKVCSIVQVPGGYIYSFEHNREPYSSVFVPDPAEEIIRVPNPPLNDLLIPKNQSDERED